MTRINLLNSLFMSQRMTRIIKRKFFTIKCGKDINSDNFVKESSIFVVHLVEIFRKLVKPKTI